MSDDSPSERGLATLDLYDNVTPLARPVVLYCATHADHGYIVRALLVSPCSPIVTAGWIFGSGDSWTAVTPETTTLGFEKDRPVAGAGATCPTLEKAAWLLTRNAFTPLLSAVPVDYGVIHSAYVALNRPPERPGPPATVTKLRPRARTPR